MLTRKILTSTAALAMTASISLLAGCPGPTTTPTPSDNGSASPTVSATPSAAATVAPTAAPVATPTAANNTGTPLPNPSATATPAAATGSSNPVGQTGGTSDIKERATFNGKVYDPNGITVDGANVNAKSVDANVSWVGESQVSTNGAYVFRNAPVGARVEITVTKDGWTTRVRTEVLKSNLQGDPTANVFDFGGLGATGNDQTSSYYAIQDEPEITELKVNDVVATNSGGFPISAGNLDDAARAAAVPPLAAVPLTAANNGRFGIANLQPLTSAELKSSIRAGQPLAVSLTGVDNSRMDIQLTFSEPVDRDSVQNNFKVVSQDFDVRQGGKGFEIDENLTGLTFTWAADDKSVLVKTNKPVLTTTTTPEARYLLKWTNPFKDKTSKNALKVGQGNISPTGHFRYNPGTNNDFNVFATKIDDQDPRLLSIEALDGGSANDVIRMTYSEPLNVVNQASQAFGLGDPTDPNNSADRQLWAYNTANNFIAQGDGVGGDGTTTNQATVVGYFEGGAVVAAPASTAGFRAVYMITRLPQNITTAKQVIGTALTQPIAARSAAAGNGADTNAQGTINGTMITGNEPNRGGQTGGNLGTNNIGNTSLLRFSKIDGNVVTLEFAPEAFNTNEKLIVSVGRNISTSYQDTSNSVSRTNININDRAGSGANITPQYSSFLIDPAGNNMSTSNSTNSGNVQVNDSIRIATAG